MRKIQPDDPQSLEANSLDREFSALLTQLGQYIVDEYGDDIKEKCDYALEGAKEKFKDEKYVKTLETLLVEGSESYLASIRVLSQFVKMGAQLNESERVEATKNALSSAKENVKYHVKYLDSSCNGCDRHGDHGFYQEVRNYKVSTDDSDYLEELEYSARFYKALYLTSLYSNGLYEANIEMFDTFAELGLDVIKERIDQSIRLHASFALDIVEVDIEISEKA